MSSPSVQSLVAIKATLSELAEDYGNDRFYECLINACGVLLREKDDRDAPLNKAAIEFIRQCVSELAAANDGADTAKQQVACSFCGRSAPEVRLGAGASVFICHECVEIFHQRL
jgi:hypothetical protein